MEDEEEEEVRDEAEGWMLYTCRGESRNRTWISRRRGDTARIAAARRPK